MEQGLSKRDSMALKGVAILMMLFHHLFRDPDIYQGYNILYFFPSDESFWNSIGQFFKICVSVFAFVSGYGLQKSFCNIPCERPKVVRWYIRRIIRTMSSFWFIYALTFIITMCINQLPLHIYIQDGQIAAGILFGLLDMFGLANLFGTPTLCGAWWYMSAAILYIVVVPVIYRISRSVGYLPVLLVVIALPRLLNTGYPGGNDPYTFLVVLILGMIFADCGIFEWIANRSPRNKLLSFVVHFMIWGSLIVFSFYIHESSYGPTVAWEFNYGIVPVFVILFCRFCVIRLFGISLILRKLGIYSTSIFLTHIFIKTTYFHDFTYGMFDNFVVVYVVFLGVSLLLAISVDLIRKMCRYEQIVDRCLSVIDKQCFKR